ncbi:MAG TPA: aquaporin [Solimonas sp.]|nr:aquaporin [Solimonas sp.]
MSLALRLRAEFLGTAFLLAAVVGSGIMAERLAGGNVALALLANALATAGVLYALILALAPVSGAQFNPAVSLALAMDGGLPWREVPAHVLTQVAGAVTGVMAAQAMFGLPLLELSTRVRTGPAQWFSECVASFGLLSLILLLRRERAAAIPGAVAAYILGAYWFTASTSFANPAVTLARALTESFAGIRLADVPGFVLAQLLAVPLAAWAWRRA